MPPLLVLPSIAHLRRWSQGKFISHEGLYMGLLNRTYNGGTNSLAQWESVMLNTYPVTELLVQRLESDFVNLVPKLRKPYSGEKIESLPINQICVNQNHYHYSLLSLNAMVSNCKTLNILQRSSTAHPRNHSRGFVRRSWLQWKCCGARSPKTSSTQSCQG